VGGHQEDGEHDDERLDGADGDHRAAKVAPKPTITPRMWTASTSSGNETAGTST
jgi:hypothetical protein